MVDNTRRVVCAALKHPLLDLIVCGPRHHDKNMHSVMSRMGEEETDVSWEQGFVNTWGEFLTREEAWEVACVNNQIYRLCGNQKSEDVGKPGIRLYSENLY